MFSEIKFVKSSIKNIKVAIEVHIFAFCLMVVDINREIDTIKYAAGTVRYLLSDKNGPDEENINQGAIRKSKENNILEIPPIAIAGYLFLIITK